MAIWVQHFKFLRLVHEMLKRVWQDLLGILVDVLVNMFGTPEEGFHVFYFEEREDFNEVVEV